MCVLRMTEGFWQNEVTLFHQVNVCGGGRDGGEGDVPAHFQTHKISAHYDISAFDKHLCEITYRKVTRAKRGLKTLQQE